MSRPDKNQLTEAQAYQLQILASLKATSAETAVDRLTCAEDAHAIKGGIIAAVLVARGFADSRKVRAWNGEPARTLYWLTAEGIALHAARTSGGSA